MFSKYAGNTFKIKNDHKISKITNAHDLGTCREHELQTQSVPKKCEEIPLHILYGQNTVDISVYIQYTNGLQTECGQNLSSELVLKLFVLLKELLVLLLERFHFDFSL